MNLSWGYAKTADERSEVYRFRYSVYVEEMHKELACADHASKTISDEIDEYAAILFVRDGAHVVGTLRTLNAARYLPESYGRWFGIERFAGIERSAISFTSRMMIAAPYRGGAVAGLLLQQVYGAARQDGVWINLIHCAPCLVSIYEKLGYRRISSRIVETDVGQHLTMAIVDDVPHLESVGSPFLPIEQAYPCDPNHAAWFKDTFREFLAPSSSKMMGSDRFLAELGQRLSSETGPLLDGIILEELRPMLRQSAIVRAQGGDYIVRRGETGSDIFIVLNGAVEVRRGVNVGSGVLRTMGRGDIFGELAVLGSGRRSADVVALTDIELLVLTPDFLERMTVEQPKLAAKLFFNLSKVLAERLLSKEDLSENDQVAFT
jgi:CRP-like cAMP-binding protein